MNLLYIYYFFTNAIKYVIIKEYNIYFGLHFNKYKNKLTMNTNKIYSDDLSLAAEPNSPE